MISLADGPVEGTYAVKRAPEYLRAIVNTLTGEKDVLDQLDDTPGDNEEVWVYKLEGEAGQVHINSTKVKGFFATGTYRLVEDVRGVDVRETVDWWRWVAERPPYFNLDTGVATTPWKTIP